MWLTHHNSWNAVEKISNGTVVGTLVLLFFSSFFPYTTSIVSANFNNRTAQVMYGIIVLSVSFSNVFISKSLDKVNPQVHFGWLYTNSNLVTFIDIAIKVVGLLLSMTIYPPAMSYAIFIAIGLIGFSFWRIERTRKQAG